MFKASKGCNYYLSDLKSECNNGTKILLFKVYFLTAEVLMLTQVCRHMNSYINRSQVSGSIKIWSVPVHFNEFWMTNLRKYEHIIYQNSDFMSKDWEKINQKFVWLKVALINIYRSTVPDFSWCHFYLILNEIKVSLSRNGLLFKKVTFKILNE